MSIKEFRAKDAETIERLGVKIRNLEVAARHEVEVKAPIDAAIRDTLIIRDTVPLLRQKVEMVTPYIQLTGLIENKRLKGDIQSGNPQSGGLGRIQGMVVLEACKGYPSVHFQ